MHKIHREQVVPASLEQVWDFIKDPNHLNAITTAELDFKIIFDYRAKMFEKILCHS